MTASRWSGSSWAALPIGKRCVMPRKRSTQLGVAHETKVVSAHRTPKRLYDYAQSAKERGLKAIIAGAGGAAHLPGMTASMTELARPRRAGRKQGAEGHR